MISSRTRSRRRSLGMTMVELMVALALGSFLLAGVGVLFAEIRQSSRVERGLGEIQESARFAVSHLSRQMRMVGYYGCGANGMNVTNTLNNSSNFDWNFDKELEGHEYTSSGSWSPALPSELSGLSPEPDNNSDIFTVRGLTNIGEHKVDRHPGGNPPGSAALGLISHGDIEECDVVVSMNCPDAAVFQITNLNTSKSELAHNTGSHCSGGPGNDTTELGTRFTGGSVSRVSTRSYFVRTDSDGVPGLWVRSARNGVRELVSGIEAMSLKYGEDTDGDQQVDAYRDADSVTDFGEVVSMRLTLLARSAEADLLASSGQQSITFEGVTYGSDGRLRRTFRTTVALRNRLQ